MKFTHPLEVVFWVDLFMAGGGSLAMFHFHRAHDQFGTTMFGMVAVVFTIAAAGAYMRLPKKPKP